VQAVVDSELRYVVNKETLFIWTFHCVVLTYDTPAKTFLNSSLVEGNTMLFMFMQTALHTSLIIPDADEMNMPWTSLTSER
jgi:hypothetical protein